MSWFRENRFLGTLAIVFGAAVLGAISFLFIAKGNSDEAAERFTNASTELNRLQRLSPYPSEENLRKMKGHTEDYGTALSKLREELKLRAVPLPALKPNEFQSQLRVAINSVTDKAHGNKVRLPDKFFLGFDEFMAALPNESTAPLLGQELAEVEWIVNTLLEARVEEIRGLHRPPGAQGRKAVEVTFFSTPAAARKAINEIASASQHFCIIRQLHVRNEKQIGPPREVTTENAPAVPSASPAAKTLGAGVLNFIVGNEKIETTAKVEMVRFAF